MSKNSSDGSVFSTISTGIGRLANEAECRFRWFASAGLVSAAVALLVFAWWLSDGGNSFSVGSPAPQDYFAHSRMKIVDQNATRALREQKISDIVGILVRDRTFMEDVLEKLRLIETGEYSAVLPDALVGILDSLPEDSRNRVITSSSVIGRKVLGSRGLPEPGEDPIWRELNASELSLPERNLSFQILDHVMAQVMVFDPEATFDLKRQTAADVVPVERILSVGEAIARKGEVVSPELAIVLRAQGYPERSVPWKTIFLVSLSVMFWTSWMWWYSERREFFFDRREWSFIVSILIAGWTAMLASSHLADNSMGILALAGWAYLGLPGSFAFHLVLWGGIIGSVITSGSSSMNLMLSVFSSVITASLGYVLMRKIESRYALIRKLLILGLALSSGLFIIRWGTYLPSDRGTLYAQLVSALAWIIVTLAALPFLEKLFGILTPIRLVDLTHPSHPLLKRLQIEAPGTYHHSIMVGTLAESAAEVLKMNGLLVKAGAYYHDVGKLKRPQFFVENQQTGHNPHDELSPTLSALIIISHVREGLEIARQYGIPKKIRLFINEHHGTTCLGYFFRKAINLEPDLQMDQFCYPGDRPRSRETALVMLADSVEAAVRAAASDMTDLRELEEAVREVIETKVSESQLDEVALTLQDLTKIKAAFIETLKHMYHTRKVAPVDQKADKVGS